MSEEKQAYTGIFKSTFLFGFVQIFNILVKVITNKAIAFLLGSEGIGIISLFQQVQQMLTQGAGLGISQSAVRDISEANIANDKNRFSKIISIVQRIIYFTSLLGILITIALSPLLSQWTFGDESYTVSYIFLSIVVGFNILTEGKLAILKGMRHLRALAKASMIGAIVGLITSLPLIYVFQKQGIIPSIIVAAISAFIFSAYFVRKVKYIKQNIALKELAKESKIIVAMGIALMLNSFIVIIKNLVISSYISNTGGLEILGYYQAGVMIISSYFGIILTAMTTDYYPRISAIHSDNKALGEAMNTQSMVGLILALPLVVIFQTVSFLLISILYSESFLLTVDFVSYAVLGSVVSICAHNMYMILLAKQRAKLFLVYSIVHKILSTLLLILLYKYYYVIGLGIGYFLTELLHFFVIIFIMNRNYKIVYERKIYLILLFAILSSLAILFFKQINDNFMKYGSQLLLVIISAIISIYYLKREMSIDIFKYIKRRK